MDSAFAKMDWRIRQNGDAICKRNQQRRLSPAGS